MSQATDSEFSMLRGAIALAWADDKLTAKEREQLKLYIAQNASISEEQRRTLMQDIKQKTSIKDVWDHITDRQDRAHLIDIAENIFLKDGTYSPKEKAVYDKLYSAHMATIAAKAIQADMRAELKRQHDHDQQDYSGISGKIDRMIHYLNKKLGL